MTQGEMTYAGFPVPERFCLTTTAFQQFITTCLDSDVREAMKKLQTGQRVRVDGNRDIFIIL
jgi:phosphoenolpyruvate synthase/pyruvate phosphate dikinase